MLYMVIWYMLSKVRLIKSVGTGSRGGTFRVVLSGAGCHLIHLFLFEKKCTISLVHLIHNCTLAADYELMLRFIHKHGIELIYWPEVLVKMRSGGKSNVTLANRLQANKEDRKAWQLNGTYSVFFHTLD
jgi:hypothetical protein